MDFMVQSEDSNELPTNNSFEPLSMMVQRHVANARERSRTTSVNVAFSILRTCIPTEPRDRKLSKVETLRLASSYISHLATLATARAEGDYDGQVCQRYGYIFREKLEISGQRYICTFCLADSKRGCQFPSSKSEKNSEDSEPPVEKIAYHQPFNRSQNYLRPKCHPPHHHKIKKFNHYFGPWGT